MRPRLVVSIVLLSAAAGIAAAQGQPSRLTLEAPKDGAWVAPKPKFVIRTDAEDVSKLRFRIEMSKDGFKTIDYTFDQLKSPNGWAYLQMENEPQGAVCFPQKKLAGGTYDWRAASWDGLSWEPGKEVFRVRIDDVAPAEVRGVRMSRQPNGCLRVSWEPVATDMNGDVERVARYHIFRYNKRSSVPSIGPFEVGTTTELQFDDCPKDLKDLPMLFYRVEAEDEAGNVFGRRIW
ncbi:MAG TPA: hypothetical protein VMR65_11650 [Candidatus Sulfotelmatobacter sp.]|jgi:hypothetical protein|nr:hypothetical protein [Candidatus Sulfotelmatobacter sp.]